MKFDMGSSTLGTLGKDTGAASDDLGTLISLLVQAAAPLEGKFNGAGKVAFDEFKRNSDDIARSLNGALSSILGGQSGMDLAFGSGDEEKGENARQALGAANFDGARFSGR
ncbi:hypothetical protein E0L36_24940 [Streptomyces sp. AJS327]|uniref:hypothetical protein n=1 Tax=Streptomyces sp. AJS327 TaxID=2545265 RepID=UPI0015DE49AD|nr:hypothetical protein [Streptomyces sp. AJS327]MBA0053978.1 hypothetical protein [Streptomyces sp. AJS327]